METIATRIRAAVDAIGDLVPRLERPHRSTRRGIQAHRTVPREFIVSVIAVIEQVQELRAVGAFDAADARETMQFIDAFRPIADQIGALADALRFTMEARKARVVAGALRTYDIARSLGRDEENSDLTAHLSILKRDLRRGRGRGRDRETH